MLSTANDMMQTTKASLSIGGFTFATGIAAIADIVPLFTAIAGLILGIFTIISKRRKNKREILKAQGEESRAQELHNLKVKLIEKELNE